MTPVIGRLAALRSAGWTLVTLMLIATPAAAQTETLDTVRVFGR